MQSPALSIPATNALGELTKITGINKFYLAGGTALAIQIEHRVSVDLDFFTPEEFDRDLLNDELAKTGKFKLDRLAENTLLGILSETKISFFTYRYSLIDNEVAWGGIRLAGLKDIAAMKIDAIGGRGIKRDFIDLYFLCQTFSLSDCFDFYVLKYPNRQDNILHIIKSLSYFEDAEKSSEPNMIVAIDWGKVMKFFERETVQLADKYLSA